MRRKVVALALVVVCSLALGASAGDRPALDPKDVVMGAVVETWLIRQRVSAISNSGMRWRGTLYGELKVTVSGGDASALSVVSGWPWDGACTASPQPWRDTTTRKHYVVFEATDLFGTNMVGYLRPNAKWTRLTGRWTGSKRDFIFPQHSTYYEVRVTAVFDH